MRLTKMAKKNNPMQGVRLLVVILMFGLTWYLLQSTSSVARVDIKKSLSSFPHTIGEYRLSNAFQSSAEVIELLGVDDYIQYNYVNDSGERINLYVGFYQAVGVDGGYHSPKNCIPGGGWGIDRIKEQPLNVGVEGEKSSTISEMLIRHGENYQVVYYWFQNRGRIIASEYWEKVYLVLDAVLKGRRDGTFVRIMSTVPGENIELTQTKVKAFSEQVMPLLEDYLPGAQI
jgi:EpsI family protein